MLKGFTHKISDLEQVIIEHGRELDNVKNRLEENKQYREGMDSELCRCKETLEQLQITTQNFTMKLQGISNKLAAHESELAKLRAMPVPGGIVGQAMPPAQAQGPGIPSIGQPMAGPTQNMPGLSQPCIPPNCMWVAARKVGLL